MAPAEKAGTHVDSTVPMGGVMGKQPAISTQLYSARGGSGTVMDTRSPERCRDCPR